MRVGGGGQGDWSGLPFQDTGKGLGDPWAAEWSPGWEGEQVAGRVHCRAAVGKAPSRGHLMDGGLLLPDTFSQQPHLHLITRLGKETAGSQVGQNGLGHHHPWAGPPWLAVTTQTRGADLGVGPRTWHLQQLQHWTLIRTPVWGGGGGQGSTPQGRAPFFMPGLALVGFLLLLTVSVKEASSSLTLI